MAPFSSLREHSRLLILWFCCIVFISQASLASSSSSSSSSSTSPLSSSSSTTPISLKHGMIKQFTTRAEKARAMAKLEQRVEDWNALWIASSDNRAMAMRRRRLICMPLDESFNPAMGSFSHDHVQTGDKAAFPFVLYEAVSSNGAEVPWLYSIKRVEDDKMIMAPRVEVSDEFVLRHDIDEVVASLFESFAPANYCFLPRWMMRALGLQPCDVVDVELKTDVPAGSLVKFRPHTSEFAENTPDPVSVLETEIRHYSALVQGSTISIKYNDKEYWFDVVELRSTPRDEKVPIVKVQDTNIRSDFIMSREDLKKKKEKAEMRKRQKEQESNE